MDLSNSEDLVSCYPETMSIIFEDQAIIFDFMSVTYRLFWLLFGFGPILENK